MKIIFSNVVLQMLHGITFSTSAVHSAPCYAEFSEGHHYVPGSIVSVEGVNYRCNDNAYSVYCNKTNPSGESGSYASIVWSNLGHCSGGMTTDNNVVLHKPTRALDLAGCPQSWEWGKNYEGGDRVSDENLVFECDAVAFGHCPYRQPGKHSPDESWQLVGSCEGIIAPTASPTVTPDAPGCPPPFQASQSYIGGDKVSIGFMHYECKEWPFSAFCSVPNFEPNSANSDFGWTKMGSCDGTISPTLSPTRAISDLIPGDCSRPYDIADLDSYVSGVRVEYNNFVFECKQDIHMSQYCKLPTFGPDGNIWSNAWNKIGWCTNDLTSPRPSLQPSLRTSISAVPSFEPSSRPSHRPSLQTSVSAVPSFVPSLEPSRTSAPSIGDFKPSQSSEPSIEPSLQSSYMPSLEPAFKQSSQPSKSNGPSVEPSIKPSASAEPSFKPSLLPSFQPSKSKEPSFEPSFHPSTSKEPTFEPSFQPSKPKEPSLEPSFHLSTSTEPTFEPSFQPSKSKEPSFEPSLHPSTSTKPTFEPSFLPSRSGEPSSTPSASAEPSTQPSSSSKPSYMPSDSCGNLGCQLFENFETCPLDCANIELATPNSSDRNAPGVLFTIEAKRNITIQSFFISAGKTVSTGATSTVRIYTRLGGYTGYTGSSDGWEKIYDASIYVEAYGNYTDLGELDREFAVNETEERSFFIYSTDVYLGYSGTTSEFELYESDDAISIFQGRGMYGEFDDNTIFPRSWHGKIKYNIQ